MSIDIILNGKPASFQGVATLGQLVAQLGFEGKRIALEHNGAIVARAQYAHTPLAALDRVEIVVAVGGG